MAEGKTDGAVERRASRDQAQWHNGGRERERERERGRVEQVRWQDVAETERRVGL